MTKTVIAYIPTLHQGYYDFLVRNAGGDLYLIGPDLFDKEHERLLRDARAIHPNVMREVLSSLKLFRNVQVLDKSGVARIPQSHLLVMIEEDVSRHVARRYFPHHSTMMESRFVRYDLPATLSHKPVSPDRTVALSDLDREMMNFAFEAAEHSPDWWRQVGAVAAKDGKILFTAFNRHMPDDRTYYDLGDPRMNFDAGQSIEVSGAQHAERVITSTAARKGPFLEGALMYITTFPCPQCSYDVATAGVARVYYRQGYSLLEAREVFESRGVEIIYVADDK